MRPAVRIILCNADIGPSALYVFLSVGHVTGQSFRIKYPCKERWVVLFPFICKTQTVLLASCNQAHSVWYLNR